MTGSTKLFAWLKKPVDAASLAVFRMVFGFLLLFESINYLVFLCLDCTYRNTSLLFKYQYFEWVRLPPGYGLEVNFLIIGIAALGVMLGWFYRISIIVLFFSFLHLFLLDQALYLNHYYLTLLFCAILIFLPAHTLWSVDARRKPGIAASIIPNWPRVWLGAQLELVLIYAGIAKLNWDWLNLEPMRLWMNYRSADEGMLLQWLTQDWGIAIASYGVIALHLIGAPLLLWRKTRLVTLIIYGVFHLTNALVFEIGIFPFLTFAATLMLFDPDWPRQFVRWLAERLKRAAPHWAMVKATAPSGYRGKLPLSLLLFAVLWMVVQIVVPLRHHWAVGNVAWNEDGHRFSWRMKLRSKIGRGTFVAIRDDGKRWEINPVDHLTFTQASRMICIPDMIWQFAQYIEEKHSDNGQHDVKVYADIQCSLNTRNVAPFVNRLVDITAITRNEPAHRWIRPLNQPLPKYLF